MVDLIKDGLTQVRHIPEIAQYSTIIISELFKKKSKTKKTLLPPRCLLGLAWGVGYFTENLMPQPSLGGGGEYPTRP